MDTSGVFYAFGLHPDQLKIGLLQLIFIFSLHIQSCTGMLRPLVGTHDRPSHCDMSFTNTHSVEPTHTCSHKLHFKRTYSPLLSHPHRW